ncbi:hypothetical protein PGT21_002787 [Puccinia graminis f. sp. tritici]|uniref:Uncharacterized protein n=1 Tax=Puccinia graminis f. sp. tritici TaxID=56615 RepID=A0A5B0NIH1_PUCGR|nr:hypothetical protein PGTUg99_015239 [Puccinia graminis f. sp. tritici]KAA1105313.1 hypothetical protein PGT21_002787 [Puccinia graminis f. sp. tritici]
MFNFKGTDVEVQKLSHSAACPGGILRSLLPCSEVSRQLGFGSRSAPAGLCVSIESHKSESYSTSQKSVGVGLSQSQPSNRITIKWINGQEEHGDDDIEKNREAASLGVLRGQHFRREALHRGP